MCATIRKDGITYENIESNTQLFFKKYFTVPYTEIELMVNIIKINPKDSTAE